MSDLLEEIASGAGVTIDQANAVLLQIRCPPEPMLSAGAEASLTLTLRDEDLELRIWCAMIDRALLGDATHLTPRNAA